MKSRHIRLFDVAAWTMVILILGYAASHQTHHVHRGHWYVATNGSDLWGDGSRDNPWHTIQYACDCCVAGDTIRIRAGIYPERIHIRRGGEEHQPVVLEADPPGAAVITGACSNTECQQAVWHDEGRGVYSTKIPWPVHVVTAQGNQLFRVLWGGVDHLREIAERPGAMDAFLSQEGRLFVTLAQGRHPRDAGLVWNQPVPPPREWGELKTANVWIEADHVVLRGIRFEFGLGAAVRIWDGRNATVEECEFTGCAVGVLAKGGASPSNHLRVLRCWYHNTPEGDWCRQWLTWREVYSSYSSSTLCQASDRPLWIHDNLVTHFGDGLQVSPNVDPSLPGVADIRGNWLAYGTDDAFELDGPGYQMEIRNNVVIDVHEGISFSPLTDGPTVICENIFWNPSGGLNGSQLKFIPSETGNVAANRIQGIRVRDNLFCGEWLAWRGGIGVSDVELRNNVFEVDRMLDPPWPSGLLEQDNLYRQPRDVRRETAAEFVESLAREDEAAAVTKTIQRASARLSEHPGPRWLKWQDHPSTYRLLQLTRNH